jgi:hypothetical protein
MPPQKTTELEFIRKELRGAPALKAKRPGIAEAHVFTRKVYHSLKYCLGNL